MGGCCSIAGRASIWCPQAAPVPLDRDLPACSRHCPAPLRLAVELGGTKEPRALVVGRLVLWRPRLGHYFQVRGAPEAARHPDVSGVESGRD